MVIGALAAMGVTYINNSKLFFGPHLLVGLGMTGMVAVSASLSPFMANKAPIYCFKCNSLSTV